MDSTPPPPPWKLSGQAVGMLTRNTLRGERPCGGTLLALVRYENSPVGPYNEIAYIALTRRGPSVIEMYVDSADSMEGGRKNWGYPKDLADLTWRQSGQNIEFKTQDKIWRVRPFGPSFNFSLKAYTVQELNGNMVKVPTKLKASACLGFHGRQLVLVLRSFTLEVFSSYFRKRN